MKISEMLGGGSTASAYEAVGVLQQKAPAGPEKDSPEAIKKAATDFEAMLVHQMLSSMWHSVPSSGLLSGSREEGMFRDMLNQAVAKDIAEGEGLGIKEVVAKDMERTANRGLGEHMDAQKT